jgi:hypothetical protein
MTLQLVPRAQLDAPVQSDPSASAASSAISDRRSPHSTTSHRHASTGGIVQFTRCLTRSAELIPRDTSRPRGISAGFRCLYPYERSPTRKETDHEPAYRRTRRCDSGGRAGR